MITVCLFEEPSWSRASVQPAPVSGWALPDINGQAAWILTAKDVDPDRCFLLVRRGIVPGRFGSRTPEFEGARLGLRPRAGDGVSVGLIVKDLKNGSANLVCNECGSIIGTVPTEEAPQILLRMAISEGMCTAICDHCGALNTFPGFTSIEAYICRECGEVVRSTFREQFSKT